MNPLSRAIILSLIALGISLYSVGFKWKYWWRYLIVFFGLWWSGWYFSPKAHADEYLPRTKIEIQRFWDNFYLYKSLKPKTRAAYIANANYHTEKAYEEYNLAQEKCWFLPKLADRERVKTAFAAFLLVVTPSTPLYKAIGILVAVMYDYGCACIDDWYDIKELLESAQSNAEMAKFYQDLLGNEG